MTDSSAIQQTIQGAQEAASRIPEPHREEFARLVKDLEEAKISLFVRTAEAKPLLERCMQAAEALKAAAGLPAWDETGERAFGEFEKAVSKLRNTILVRTQRAT
jgi:hypothetical protein